MNNRMGQVVAAVLAQGFTVVPAASGAYHFYGKFAVFTVPWIPRTNAQWFQLANGLRAIGVNVQFGWEAALDG